WWTNSRAGSTSTGPSRWSGALRWRRVLDVSWNRRMKWIKFLVSGALLALLAWRTDWARLSAAFAGLRLNFWLAAVGLYVLTQVVSAVRWQMLSRPLGFEQPLSHYVGFYFIGMFFNLFLPTSVGGDVVRAW